MKPLRITQYRLAQEINVPQTRISQIVRGKRAVTADTAVRLSVYFGTSADLWLGIQAQYELELVEREAGERIRQEVKSLPQPLVAM